MPEFTRLEFSVDSDRIPIANYLSKRGNKRYVVSEPILLPTSAKLLRYLVGFAGVTKLSSSYSSTWVSSSGSFPSVFSWFDDPPWASYSFLFSRPGGAVLSEPTSAVTSTALGWFCVASPIYSRFYERLGPLGMHPFALLRFS